MSIAEKIGRITPGKQIDMAPPSREQQAKQDELEAVLQMSRRAFRERQIKRQYTDPDPDRPPKASPLTGDDYTYQHGRQSPGVRRLSPLGQDILGAMVGLPEFQVALVLTKWAQDRSSQSRAFNMLFDRVGELFEQKNWRTKDADKGKDIMRSMCRLALFEFTDPRCDRCKGRAENRNGKPCPKCAGSGNLKITERDRAVALGVKEASYKMTHRRRYRAVYAILRRESADALEQMRLELYGY